MSKNKEFKDHFSNWELSGLNKSEYCKREGLTYWWFLYHSKLAKQDQGGFSKVNFDAKVSKGIGTGSIEYHLADGSYFIFPVNCSVNIIRQLIA